MQINVQSIFANPFFISFPLPVNTKIFFQSWYHFVISSFILSLYNIKSNNLQFQDFKFQDSFTGFTHTARALFILEFKTVGGIIFKL